MLYTTKPLWFHADLDVVWCFVEYDGDILLLQRQFHKKEWNLYGMPAGKVDTWESKDEAMQRELYEETWLVVSDMKYIIPTYVEYPDKRHITYHIYHTLLEEKPLVTLRTTEHQSYLRITPKEALNIPLMQDLDRCIQLFYNTNNV